MHSRRVIIPTVTSDHIVVFADCQIVVSDHDAAQEQLLLTSFSTDNRWPMTCYN